LTGSDARIMDIERPHPRLLWLYMIRAVLTGPGVVIMAPLLFFRYETMRFRFDAEGIHMRWGILFRRQINLTYARIQDIHLTSGLIQRWFGLADVKIQTASGSADAEMTLEGLMEFEAVRDFLYARMRGYRDAPRHVAGVVPVSSASATPQSGAVPVSSAPDPGEDGAALLREAVEELRAIRRALEQRAHGPAEAGRHTLDPNAG
jgi:putative membrane protein